MSWTGVVEAWRTSRKRAFTCQRLGSSPPRCQVLTTKSARKLTASADYSGAGSVWHCESRQVRWPAIVRPGVLPFNSRASRLCFLPCTKQSPTTPAASQRIQVSCNTPFRNLHQSKKQRSRFLLRLAFSRRFYLFTDAAASHFHSKKVRASIGAGVVIAHHELDCTLYPMDIHKTSNDVIFKWIHLKKICRKKFVEKNFKIFSIKLI